MITSTKTQRKEVDNWGKDKLKELLITNQVKNQNEVIDFYENMINLVNQSYPNLKEEFNQALNNTLSMVLSGIVVDNSLVVSPLIWFANKYNYDDLSEICNQLSLQVFDIQIDYLSSNSQNQSREGIEF
jgi:hypothetical protein